MARTYLVGNPLHLAAYRRGRRQRARKAMVAGLMLTPMVDMFSLLVIFLLQFFTAAPDFNLTNGIVLPQSVSTTGLNELPIVSLARDQVLVEHQPVGALTDVLANPAALVQALAAVQAHWVATHPGAQIAAGINLEAHQDIESTVVATIMGILAAQHFGSIQLIALAE